MSSLARYRSNVIGRPRGVFTRIAARQATRFARNMARRWNQPNQSRMKQQTNLGSTDNPLTTQHDFKVDYRRRKRTRKLRRRIRRGRRFTRRVVNSYIRATETPKKIAKLAQFTRICIPNTSNYFAAMLHTADGLFTGDNPQADWREFFIEGSAQNKQGWDDYLNTSISPIYPDISRRQRSIRCHSSNMELTIRNSGNSPAIVSVYRIVCKRSFQAGGETVERLYEYGFQYSGRVTEIAQPVEDGAPAGMWDPQMTPGQLTSTPFQSFMFTKHFTIYRRTKYQLAPGEEINLLLKSNRPKVVSMSRARGYSCMAGLTHGYFVDFQGVPQYNSATNETSSSGAQLSVQKMVRYTITQMPDKRPSTTYDVQDPV